MIMMMTMGRKAKTMLAIVRPMEMLLLDLAPAMFPSRALL